MQQGRNRKWVRRAVGVVALVAVLGGTWASLNATELRAKYAASRFKSAATDEERAKWADTLLGYGDVGVPRLVGFVRSDDTACRSAAAAAIAKHLDALPESDPRGQALGGQLLDAFASCPDGGKAAVLELLPAVLKRGGAAHETRCREVVAAGLANPSPEARVLAVRLAMHPRIKMRADLVPLLGAAEPEVRRAALFAVGPASDGEVVIGDEDLFRWLHDPDDGVRKCCHDSLVSRGRTDPEIQLGRRLTNPDATERLKLLADLRYDDEVPDPEPWLERLSRDAEPGVRAGAVRVAVEWATDRRVPVPVWVGRVADADPDATVRRVAGFYRSLPTPGATGVRPAGGP